MAHAEIRQDIQGLRAIAVLTVFLFHINKAWLPGGFIGVDIFFVISGFVISENILRGTSQGTFSFAGFYLARIRRIVPAMAVLVSLVTLVSALILLPKDFDLFRESANNTLYFLSNGFFAKQDDYFAPGQSQQPLLHTWSVAVEMQFYLLYPFVLRFAPQKWRPWLLALLLAGFTAWAQWNLVTGYRQLTYFSLLARIPEFLAGGLVALLPQMRPAAGRKSEMTAWIGMLILAACCLWLSEGTLFPGLAALPVMIGSSAILLARASLPGRILSSRAMVWIGDRSYSIYLWHWPVLALLRYCRGAYVLPFVDVLAAVAVTLLCAEISYRFIETPLRARMPDYRKWAVLVAGIVAVLLVRQPVNSGLATDIPVEMTRYADENLICHGKMVGDCWRGDLSRNDPILVLGDSHAAQLNHAFDAIGKAEGLKFRVVTASSCVNVPAFDPSFLEPKPKQRCLKQIEQAKTFTAEADRILIAGKWALHMAADKNFLNELDAFLTQTDKAGIRVALLGDIPLLRAYPLRVLHLNKLGIPAGNDILTETYRQGNEAVEALAGKHANTVFLSMADLPILASPPFFEDKLVYMDDNHLNEPGSFIYGEQAAGRVADWARKAATQGKSQP